jgi:hypothetical protein
MNSVVVSFGEGHEYEVRVAPAALAAQDAQAARQWFDREFVELECSPSNPVGKLLIVDQILNVAKYAGENAFMHGGNNWTADFACNTLKALDRDFARIDTQAFAMSY